MDVAEVSGLLSNQGEKSINFYFIIVPFKKKSIKVWYSKAQVLGLGVSLSGFEIERVVLGGVLDL